MANIRVLKNGHVMFQEAFEKKVAQIVDRLRARGVNVFEVNFEGGEKYDMSILCDGELSSYEFARKITCERLLVDKQPSAEEKSWFNVQLV